MCHGSSVGCMSMGIAPTIPERLRNVNVGIATIRAVLTATPRMQIWSVRLYRYSRGDPCGDSPQPREKPILRMRGEFFIALQFLAKRLILIGRAPDEQEGDDGCHQKRPNRS